MQELSETSDKLIRHEPPSRISPKLEAGMAAVCMGLMTAIVFVNVLVRYFTNASLAFTEEFAIFLMLAMTLFGVSAAAARNKHIRITILLERLRPGQQRLLDHGASLMSAMTFSVLAVLSGFYTYDIWRFEEVSSGIGIPMWLYWIWVPLLSIAIVFRILDRAIRIYRSYHEVDNVH